MPLYAPPPKDKRRFWLRPGEKAPGVAAPGLRERKRMLIMAIDFEGIAFWHLCGEKETVTSEVYKIFLETYIPNWTTSKRIKSSMLLQYNARPHKSRLISDYLKENKIETWVHPTYSPDIHPCDFNCFGPLKRQLKDNSYNNWTEVKDAIQNAIEEGLQKGLFKGVAMLPERWQ